MKNKFKIFLAILIFTFIFEGCKKDKVEEMGPTPVTEPAPLAFSFLKDGNEWIYDVLPLGTTDTIKVLTHTNDIYTIDFFGNAQTAWYSRNSSFGDYGYATSNGIIMSNTSVVGDVYMRLNPIDTVNDYIKREIIAVDSVITVTAGTFTTTVIKNSQYNSPSTDYLLLYIDKLNGLIKHETYTVAGLQNTYALKSKNF